MRITYLIAVVVFVFLKAGSAQELEMSSGFVAPVFYLDDEKISKTQLRFLINDNQAALDHWKKSKTYKSLMWGSVGLNLGFLILNRRQAINGDRQTALIGVGGSSLMAIAFWWLSNKEAKALVDAHNASTLGSQIYLGPTGNGVGLVYGF